MSGRKVKWGSRGANEADSPDLCLKTHLGNQAVCPAAAKQKGEDCCQPFNLFLFPCSLLSLGESALPQAWWHVTYQPYASFQAVIFIPTSQIFFEADNLLHGRYSSLKLITSTFLWGFKWNLACFSAGRVQFGMICVSIPNWFCKTIRIA